MAPPLVRGIATGAHVEDEFSRSTPSSTEIDDTVFVFQAVKFVDAEDMNGPIATGVSFTELALIEHGDLVLGAWRGVVTAAGARSVQFRQGGNDGNNYGILVTCQGEHAVDSAVVTNGFKRTSATLTLGSVTPSDSGAQLWGIWGLLASEIAHSGQMIDTPASMDALRTQAPHLSSNNAELVLGREQLASASATGTRSAVARNASGSSFSQHTGMAGIMFALRRVAAAVPPTVEAGENVPSHTVNTTLPTRVATVTDNGGAITAQEWRVVSGPAQVNVVLSTNNTLSGWSPNAIGTYEVRFSATNAAGTGQDLFSVTVAQEAVDPGLPIPPPPAPPPTGTASGWSNEVSGSTNFRGAWIHIPDQPETTLRLRYGGVGRQRSMDRAKTALQFVGRQYPVYDVGEARAESIQVSSTLITEDGDSEQLIARAEEFGKNAQVVLYRDGRGRKMYAMPTDWSSTDEDMGAYTVSFLLNRVDYEESLQTIAELDAQ